MARLCDSALCAPADRRTVLLMTTTRWNRDERGSADRYQMRLYATRVLMALTGGVCPLTGRTVDADAAEIDRCDPAKGYVPGNVILVSEAGNQARAALQSNGQDIAGAARYAADVLRVSLTVDIPTKAESKVWWQATRQADPAEILAGGQYA